MKIAKNMEAVFAVALGLAAFTAYATADVNEARSPAAKAQAEAAANTKMVSIVVTTKRLTAAQKAELDS